MRRWWLRRRIRLAEAAYREGWSLAVEGELINGPGPRAKGNEDAWLRRAGWPVLAAVPGCVPITVGEACHG